MAWSPASLPSWSARCRELTVQINALERELRTLVGLAPALLAVPGCGVLGAAASSARPPAPPGSAQRRLRPVHRHRPDPGLVRQHRREVRLNRGGNRRMNCALHMIAVTQARGIGPGKDYLDKALARGKTRTEALRLLRRRLSDTVFPALLATTTAADGHRPALPQAA